jgi:prolipoprotein diacylglyceryltransferase
MLPVLQIWRLALPAAPLAIMLGAWLAAWLAEREAARLALPADTISTLTLVLLAGWVVGARLGYAAQFAATYAADPLSLVSPNPATLDPSAGVAVAILAGLAFGWRRALPLWPTLDALAPGLAALLLALGVAHLASGDAFGAPADLPWSITLWGARRHPTQLYEIAAALLILAAWWRLRNRLPFAGAAFLLVLGGAAGTRLLLEAFRGDSWLLAGGLRGAQLVALGLLLVVLVLLRQRALAVGAGQAVATKSATRG